MNVAGHTVLSIAGAVLSAAGLLVAMPLALHTWSETTFDGYIYLLLALGLGIYRHKNGVAVAAKPVLLVAASVGLLAIFAGLQTEVEAIALLGYAICAVCLLYYMFPNLRKIEELWALALLVVCGVPFWMAAVPILQYIATGLSVAMLELSGLSLFTEGFVVSVPNGTFLVDIGCSGFRYVCSAIAIATIYAKTGQMSLPRSLLLVATAAAAALLANGIRIAWIIHIGNETQMRSPLVEDHAWLGWVIFALTVVPLCALLGRRLERATATDAPSL